MHVPDVTLSTEADNKFLEQLKSGFKKTIKWNRYRLEMTNQTKTNNLSYLIDPTFSKVSSCMSDLPCFRFAFLLDCQCYTLQKLLI